MRSVFNTPLLTPLIRAAARLGLRLSGWRVEGTPNLHPPFVFIGAPHTSNWDFVLMLAMVLDSGLEACWLGKHTLFRAPWGGLMRWLGGIPVNREASLNQVDDIAAFLRAHPTLGLCVTPEGTRRRVNHWRTGFYHIAMKAGVPILPTIIDADARLVRVRALYHPTGDAQRDIVEIQHLYRGYRGLIRENTGDFAHHAEP